MVEETAERSGYVTYEVMIEWAVGSGLFCGGDPVSSHCWNRLSTLMCPSGSANLPPQHNLPVSCSVVLPSPHSFTTVLHTASRGG